MVYLSAYRLPNGEAFYFKTTRTQSTQNKKKTTTQNKLQTTTTQQQEQNEVVEYNDLLIPEDGCLVRHFFGRPDVTCFRC